MYRVFNHYAQYNPPYADKPPFPLRPGKDYEVSHGTTYYDLRFDMERSKTRPGFSRASRAIS
jgi:hypothetical protein